MRSILVLGAVAGALAGCSFNSSVMDTGNGTYAVTGQASPLGGGSEQAAYGAATAFCAKDGMGRPVVAGIERPVLGNQVTMHFRCAPHGQAR